MYTKCSPYESKMIIYKNRIKKYRVKCGIKPSGLARMLGVPRQYVYAWENNIRQPESRNVVLKMLRIFRKQYPELSIGDLYYFD